VSQPLNRYKADLRDFHFVLFEQLDVGSLLGKGIFAAWGPDEIRGVLDQTYRFAKDVLGPLNAVGDREGCRVEDGRVKTPTGFKDAWDQAYALGIRSLTSSPDHGGAGAPNVLAVAVEELTSGANAALNMYSGLTHGVAEIVALFGTEGQKHQYVLNLNNGRWGGTMCLTEPQAGSDVGMAKTSASLPA